MTTYPTSVVPELIDALVANATVALPTVIVNDGFGVSADDLRDSVLMIGVDDPNSQVEAGSGESEQEWANIGNQRRDETGYVTCAAVGWSGDQQAKEARDAAYAIVSAVENMLRNNVSQGIARILWCSFGGRTTLLQDQGQTGASATVIFRVNFRARL